MYFLKTFNVRSRVILSARAHVTPKLASHVTRICNSRCFWRVDETNSTSFNDTVRCSSKLFRIVETAAAEKRSTIGEQPSSFLPEKSPFKTISAEFETRAPRNNVAERQPETELGVEVTDTAYIRRRGDVKLETVFPSVTRLHRYNNNNIIVVTSCSVRIDRPADDCGCSTYSRIMLSFNASAYIFLLEILRAELIFFLSGGLIYSAQKERGFKMPLFTAF